MLEDSGDISVNCGTAFTGPCQEKLNDVTLLKSSFTMSMELGSELLQGSEITAKPPCHFQH